MASILGFWSFHWIVYKISQHISSEGTWSNQNMKHRLCNYGIKIWFTSHFSSNEDVCVVEFIDSILYRDSLMDKNQKHWITNTRFFHFFLVSNFLGFFFLLTFLRKWTGEEEMHRYSSAIEEGWYKTIVYQVFVFFKMLPE